MGNLCSCCKLEQKRQEYKDHLIQDIYCPKCKIIYLSNYEYNKHIIHCNQINNLS